MVKAPGERWRILVVDDDAGVHAVTRLVLQDLQFHGRGIEILTAKSGAEARERWAQLPDIALVLLDVVMEFDQAGLEFVRFVREDAKNPFTRIVLRTGQPGQAPPVDAVTRYDIDDYQEKTNLTSDRLTILVITSLRTYGLLRQLDDRYQELLQSNRELEQFAYIASHDLQAPIRNVVSFSQLLESEYQKLLDGRAREYLHYVVQSGLQMQALVKDLLAFSRVTNIQAQPEATECEVALKRVLEMMVGVVQARNAQITHDPLPQVSGPEHEIAQLLQNLIGNAIKFQPGDKPKVHISAERDGRYWKFAVRDWGIGIKPEHHERIFQMFQRLHTTDQYEGTGIGLALCQKIVTRHGGRIWVESEPGKGSTFYFTLMPAA